MSFHITKILSEHPQFGFHQRHVMFETENIDNMEKVFSSSRCDPFKCENEEINRGLKERATYLFRRECEVFKLLSESGHTPRYITHGGLIQSNIYEYPGGYLNILAVATYPDLALDDAYYKVSRSDIPLLRTQLLDMAVYFGKLGLEYGGIASMYKYDAVNQILYATDIDLFEDIEIDGNSLSINKSPIYWIKTVVEQLESAVKRRSRPDYKIEDYISLAFSDDDEEEYIEEWH